MKCVEKTAKTVEEAVMAAVRELGIEREEAEIEVLEEPSRGILGFIGAKPARVRVSVKDTPQKRAEELLQSVFRAMNLDVKMTCRTGEREILINVEGPEAGVLIGRRGETLDALQYLINLSVNKNFSEKKKVLIDVEGYRSRREETLQKLALKMAEKAKKKGKSIALEPMSSQERRIIHTALQGRNDIYTYSEGEEPFRKIVISPKKMSQ